MEHLGARAHYTNLDSCTTKTQYISQRLHYVFHKSRSPSLPYGPAPQGSQLIKLAEKSVELQSTHGKKLYSLKATMKNPRDSVEKLSPKVWVRGAHIACPNSNSLGVGAITFLVGEKA